MVAALWTLISLQLIRRAGSVPSERHRHHQVLLSLENSGQLEQAAELGSIRTAPAARLIRLGCGGVMLLFGGLTVLLAVTAGQTANALSGGVFCLLGVITIAQGLSSRSFTLKARSEAAALSAGDED